MTPKNDVLRSLSHADLKYVQPYLEPVELPRRTYLERRGSRIEYVHFIEQGFASVVADAPQALSVEVGLIGSDGLTGVGVVLGAPATAPYDTFMQVGGTGLRLKADQLERCLEQSRSLQRTILSFVNRYLVQVSRTAEANARNKVEERLARWLLLARRPTTRPSSDYSRVVIDVAGCVSTRCHPHNWRTRTPPFDPAPPWSDQCGGSTWIGGVFSWGIRSGTGSIISPLIRIVERAELENASSPTLANASAGSAIKAGSAWHRAPIDSRRTVCAYFFGSIPKR